MHVSEPFIWKISDAQMEQARRDGFLVPPEEARVLPRPAGSIVLVVAHATPYWVPVDGVALTLDPTFPFWPFEQADAGLEFVVDLAPGYGEWNGGFRTNEVLRSQHARLLARLEDLLATSALRKESSVVVAGDVNLARASASAHHIYRARHTPSDRTIGYGGPPELLQQYGFPAGFNVMEYSFPVDEATQLVADKRPTTDAAAVPTLVTPRNAELETSQVLSGSSASWTAGDFFNAGDVVGNYEITEFIQAGGMGAVYRVRDLRTGERVVLKHLLDVSEHEVKRFAREVRAMRSIAHRNVMPVLDAQLEHWPPFFVMPEASMRFDEAFRAPLADERAALEAILAVCEGVAAVHAAGHVHRDLKQLNLLLLEDDWVVTDLGLVVPIDRSVTTTLTRTGSLVGTLEYMAPEQFIKDQQVDARADIFAIGAILYGMYTGGDPRLLDPDKLPVGMRALVAKATQQLPDRRYASVDLLAAAIRAYVATLGTDFDPLGQARSMLTRWSELRTAERAELVRLISGLGDLEAKSLLDGLESDQLRMIADEVPEVFVEAVDRFKRALAALLPNQHGYGYTDVLAAKLTPIWTNGVHLPARVMALRCILVAAVAHWRFKTLDSLFRLLEAIPDPESAEAVASGFLEEPEHAARAFEYKEDASLPDALLRARAMLRAEAGLARPADS